MPYTLCVWGKRSSGDVVFGGMCTSVGTDLRATFTLEGGLFQRKAHGSELLCLVSNKGGGIVKSVPNSARV